ncbi:Lrp/AsnC family transcriptional regulator [uncultured Roseobacter sp.]|uniref:Lrp/AsnC family transcriptional regulator n=1 Tax=uncultured Roseobacter sp. TaxID=114847 RepID=UPI0026288AF5|nr:Lrp/AsnC family transcriptional regulator [uncultured Roseobacter sp.]
MQNLDSFDRQLLEQLQIDSRQTGRDLSQKVGLSSAACLRRVQRLRKIGAIEREVAVISPSFQGPATRVIVLLSVARDNPQRIDILKQKLRRLKEVERLYYVTGDADLAVIVRCASMEDYAAFTETHLFDPPLTGFESLVVLREYPKEAD